MINGVNHITFAVRNLDESIKFYVELLGLKLVAHWDKGAYLLAGNIWIALNKDEKARTEPFENYTHIAFNVLSTDYLDLKERLIKGGVETFKDNTSEGDSFYFLDPDGHKLELHYNTLEHRLEWARNNDWPSFSFD
ncbi:VOC family protein [Wukongibacter baidiensis]|uniref:VOC family protein n=1 Tax=Wukongibacter baidiensis TaxID=1723361 RepID=UPI003D7F82DC